MPPAMFAAMREADAIIPGLSLDLSNPLHNVAISMERLFHHMKRVIGEREVIMHCPFAAEPKPWVTIINGRYEVRITLSVDMAHDVMEIENRHNSFCNKAE
jgi:hypothetical protein